MASRTLPALEMVVPGDVADQISGLLWENGSTGIEELEGGLFRAHFVAAPPAGHLRRLRAAGARRVRRVAIPVEDWVAMGRARVRAVRVGSILVRPPWSRARPRPGERLVVIDPARAFGTANHESTRLALAEMQAAVVQGKAVLDVGTGSGVLALAALRLGARRAFGCDIDPEAIAAASENARRNRLSGRLELELGGASVAHGTFDLVLANLTLALLESEAPAIAARVAASGTLVAAGFLDGDREQVAAGFGGHGLLVASAASEAGWSALRLVRSGRAQLGRAKPARAKPGRVAGRRR